MKVFGKQFRFGDPEQVNIVIFDECNSQHVRRALSPNHRIGVFNMRPYEILIGPSIFLQALRCAHHFSLSEAVGNSRGLMFGVLFQVRNIYFEACLISMKPKAVVTSIDNSSSFHWLSKHSREFPYIAIQNGSRLRYAITEDHGYYLQHYFCWGTHESELFEELGCKIENYYPVGSLLASLYFEQPCDMARIKYDLLVVSTWRGDIGFPPDVVDTMRSMKIMDQLLVKYIASRQISAAVILRAQRDSEHWVMPGIGNEYDYYRGIYGDSVEIIEADFTTRTIYPSMQSSEVIVSCLSSALLEAYGIGKKVLYCNFTGTNAYHGDFDPCIVADESDFEEFSRRLDDLLVQPAEEYRKQHGENMQKMMSFPGGRSTYEVIAESVDKIIEDFKCRG